MRLKILLPYRVFAIKERVLNIVAETELGSYGFLPNRLDCIAPLVPGILMYKTHDEGETFVAVDQGILVKTGPEVVVSVRHAIGGVDLGQLESAVKQQFLDLDERERSVRSTMAKLESSFIRRYMELKHE
ncbi:MAG TPA: F0F1 ATP synthase subunit epsilon [Chlorobaculum sp.]|uniref:ATP synthase F1, epsilon subunit n=2 Tax=Chlorobaculum tepidum TaxID=1097 RepID=Q8KDL5_CHLTE|nr:ATP synthase F1, epsilon subunit [Chlorobaculum tepidum TLS]HBU22781.1 F0F1 ATP synthase subunit epsilon [Chlorobaculum sp.]